MSIVTQFDYFKKPVAMKPLLDILHQIKRGKYKNKVKYLRRYFEEGLDTEFDAQKRIMPRFSVSGNFILKNEKLKLISYTNFFLMEIPYLNGKDLKFVRKQLINDPFVSACFSDALGNGLVFIVQSASTQEDHQEMFRFAVNYYRNLTGVRRFSFDGLELDHTVMVSADEAAYIDLKAIPLSSNLRKLASI